jgi:WD40 repeat protein
MSNQTLVAELPIRTDSYSPFSVSPDGQILVIGNYETQGDLQFWSLVTKQMVREYKGGEQVRHLSFNILGNLLAVGRVDRSFNVLDMGSGETVASRGGHASNCEGITFNSITGQLTVINDASIDVWDNTLQQIQYNLKNPKGCEVSQIEYSPNGEILAASMFWEKQILLWKTGIYLTTLTHSNSGTIWKIAWSPNGRLLAAAENTSPGQIVLWDVQSQKIAHVLEGYGSEVSFSPDGKYILTQSEQGALVLLSLSRSKKLNRALLRVNLAGRLTKTRHHTKP